MFYAGKCTHPRNILVIINKKVADNLLKMHILYKSRCDRLTDACSLREMYHFQDCRN